MTETEKNQQEILSTETKIKLLLLAYALYRMSKKKFLVSMAIIVQTLEDSLPIDLIDREQIIEDVIKSTEEIVKKEIEPIRRTIEKSEQEDVFEVKGGANVPFYEDVVKRALKGLDKRKLTTSEKGKRPITIWQKMELDIRHDAQMKMVDEARKSGIDLWWLSSHIDASNRCEKWQGKLVSLSKKPKSPFKFWTGEEFEGHKIYSFDAIENVVDKYGYKNNIINGFNCRHKMIPITEQIDPPKTWDKTNVEKEYRKNNYIRALERKIRKIKQLMLLEKECDRKAYLRHKNHVASLTTHYKEYCAKNGFPIELWRLKV